ncbi:MAG: hypothetical protein V3T72_15345 [Thermoanaerobaculia bacterium]
MSTSPFDWPALRSPVPEAPLAYERAVWGKVHGARSDFRWIAASAGFDRSSSLERQLTAGVEDRPHRATFWRALPETYLSVGLYPSRSTDAAGRGGSLIEKQILAWRPSADLPAAFGALLLLPHVAELNDEVWWSRRSDSRWSEDDFALSLDASDHQPLAADGDRLRAAIERGIEALRAAVPETALVSFYAQLLAGREPAWLRGLERPLAPEALAVLLLPLPRSRADRLSIAGWIPSSRVDLDQLAKRWQVLVEPADRKLAPDDPEISETSEDGWALAQALLDGEPSLALPVVEKHELALDAEPPRSVVVWSVEGKSGVEDPKPAPAWDPFGGGPMRPGVELPLSAPAPESPTVLRKLHAFARAADRRWLTPRDLAVNGACRPLRADDPAAGVLLEWVRQVEDHRPVYAHPEQWAVKVDLLRAAAIALIPDPSTLEDVGRMMSGRVPPLLFGGLIEPRLRDGFAAFGGEPLSRLIDESLRCDDERLRGEVVDWLGKWRGSMDRRWVRSLLALKLAQE